MLTCPASSPKPSRLVLTARYAVFAVFATALNLGAQAVSLHVYHGLFALTLAMMLGTGVGLVIKYMLDRRWIFFDRARSLQGHGVAFTLYTVMGVITTAIFWGAELLANAISPDLTFVGAALGLAVGYVVKYRLDRRFVFGESQP